MYIYLKPQPLSPSIVANFDAVNEFPTLDQFFDQGHLRHLEPCRKFIVRIIEDAMDCIAGHSVASNLGGAMLMCHRGNIAQETLSWVSDPSEAPYTFLWCCNILGIDCDLMKKQMLKVADYPLMEMARRIKLHIWRNKKAKTKGRSPLPFHGVIEIDGERTEVGVFATRSEAARALSKEFDARGGGNWVRVESAA